MSEQLAVQILKYWLTFETSAKEKGEFVFEVNSNEIFDIRVSFEQYIIDSKEHFIATLKLSHKDLRIQQELFVLETHSISKFLGSMAFEKLLEERLENLIVKLHESHDE